MDVKTIFSVASAILASLGGGAIVAFAFSSWLGKVWASRIVEADKSQMSQRAGDRTRKIESLMKHYERQIEEFYGPLFNMVNQIFVANHVEWELLNTKQNGQNLINDENMREMVRDYFQKTYFLPLHDEIISIMRSKLYLVEGAEVPETFYLYLKHAAQERDQRILWKQHGIDSSFLRGEPWPDRFYDDIKKGFETAMKRHESCLEGLKA